MGARSGTTPFTGATSGFFGKDSVTSATKIRRKPNSLKIVSNSNKGPPLKEVSKIELSMKVEWMMKERERSKNPMIFRNPLPDLDVSLASKYSHAIAKKTSPAKRFKAK